MKARSVTALDLWHEVYTEIDTFIKLCCPTKKNVRFIIGLWGFIFKIKTTLYHKCSLFVKTPGSRNWYKPVNCEVTGCWRSNLSCVRPQFVFIWKNPTSGLRRAESRRAVWYERCLQNKTALIKALRSSQKPPTTKRRTSYIVLCLSWSLM